MNISRKHNINRLNKSKVRVYSADEYEEHNDYSEDSLSDNVEELSDNVEELQDQIDDMDVEEDEPDIELNNNIADHYIAECDRCSGVFISSVVLSDQAVDSISGICPLCDHETTQQLKWVVKSISDIEQ